MDQRMATVAEDWWCGVVRGVICCNRVLQREVGDMVNGGVIYVQNAHPQGPAVWALQELSRRVRRMTGECTRIRHAPLANVPRGAQPCGVVGG
jgi:hypothetical protein